MLLIARGSQGKETIYLCKCARHFRRFKTHDWLEELEKEEKKVLKSSEMPCTFAEIDKSDIESLSKEELYQPMNEIQISNLLQKKNCSTGFCRHAFTYKKGTKGRFLYMLLIAR